MSERTQAIVAAYTPLERGAAESRWIRLRQVGRQDESISMSEAAEIIDELYGVQPCETGMGGGGKGADEEPPDEDEFKVAMSEMFHRAGMCFEESYWVADVDVLRSHRQPGYELRTTGADVERVRPIRESVREVVEVSGAVIELSMPYDGGLTGIPAGVKWEVRGSTVNLDRPVYARLTLRYNTYYERVTLHTQTDFEGKDDPVRRAAAEYAPGDIYAVAGYKDPNNTHYRPELPEAGLIAFWGDLAASCELLNPNGQDDSVDIVEIRTECNPPSGGGGGEGEIEDPCTGFVHHYMLCNCSRKRVDGAITTEPIECPKCSPDWPPGKCEKLFHRDQFDGFVRCEGEEDELSDPEYYRKRCCESPPGSSLLPRCRKSYGVYSGGHEIESGPEHWQNIYGQDVIMTPVLPENGICGEEITEWDVPQKSCCDEAEPLRPWEGNSSTIMFNGSVALCVEGGISNQLIGDRPKFTWKASGGYTFDNGASVKRGDAYCEIVNATRDACDNGVVEVTDGCSTVRMPLTMEDPPEPMRLAPDEASVSGGTHLWVEARNARGDVQWDGGGLKMLRPQGDVAMLFEVPDDFCGKTHVMATDACGQNDEMLVLSNIGRWVEDKNFDPCVSPPGMSRPCMSDNVGYGPTSFIHVERGYRAEFRQVAGYVNQLDYRTGGCGDFEGSCSDAVAAGERHMGGGEWESPCGYTGLELFYNADCHSVPVQPIPGPNAQIVSPLCHKEKRCTWMGQNTYLFDRSVYAASQWVSRLWKWECDDENG